MSGSYDSILRAPPGPAPENLVLYPPVPADLDPQVIVGLSAAPGTPEDVVLWPMGQATQQGSYLLTGLRAAALQGGLAPTMFGALTGQVATGTAGAVSFGSGDTSIALIGLAATGAQGALVPALALALSGAAATTTQGALTPEVGAKPLGQAATGAGGLLGPATDKALTGLAATGAGGLLAPGIAVVLTGLGTTATQGQMTTSGQAVTAALTGLRATLTPGLVFGVVDVAVALRSQALFYQTQPVLMWATILPVSLYFTRSVDDMYYTNVVVNVQAFTPTVELVA